jgi:hypothetical protein
MTIPGWIVFGIGVLFILLGAGLMVSSSVSKRSKAEVKSSVDQGILKDILDFILKLFELFLPIIPANAMAQVGFMLLIIGIGLVILPFVIPGL